MGIQMEGTNSSEALSDSDSVLDVMLSAHTRANAAPVTIHDHYKGLVRTLVSLSNILSFHFH